MAVIKPLKALRFTSKSGAIKELTCPPYDIISEEQRLSYIAGNDHNVIRLELPRGEDPYEQAGQTLKAWLKEGALAQDEQDGIYIYEEKFTAQGKPYSVKGFICLVKLEDFSKGIVLPHEETLSKAKNDRFALMSQTFCNFSQIYSLYIDEKNDTRPLIDRLSDRPADLSFCDDSGVTHSLWCVNDADAIAAVSARMADKKLYIADGHHRYETALNFAKHLREQGENDDDSALCNYCMMMLVNMEHEGLVVFPTHRIVRDLSDFDSNVMLDKCRSYFEITTGLPLDRLQSSLDDEYAKGSKAFGFYDGGDLFTLLVLKDNAVMRDILPDMSQAYRQLDVSILHSLILERLFGIDKENMANQINLTYTRVLEEALVAVREGHANCSFILNPTKVTEIRDVASAGEKMPQKSTYFYPKLITGLVMNKFGDKK